MSVQRAARQTLQSLMTAAVRGDSAAAESFARGLRDATPAAARAMAQATRSAARVNTSDTRTAETAARTAGGRALGGGVTAGRVYEIGEQGRELFMPGVSGQVVANRILRELASPVVEAPAGQPELGLFAPQAASLDPVTWSETSSASQFESRHDLTEVRQTALIARAIQTLETIQDQTLQSHSLEENMRFEKQVSDLSARTLQQTETLVSEARFDSRRDLFETDLVGRTLRQAEDLTRVAEIAQPTALRGIEELAPRALLQDHDPILAASKTTGLLSAIRPPDLPVNREVLETLRTVGQTLITEATNAAEAPPIIGSDGFRGLPDLTVNSEVIETLQAVAQTIITRATDTTLSDHRDRTLTLSDLTERTAVATARIDRGQANVAAPGTVRHGASFGDVHFHLSVAPGADPREIARAAYAELQRLAAQPRNTALHDGGDHDF
ncbi:hypothetical protein JANAI62_28640 [Jannaschia pagri]|uniref:Hook-length control protein FliK n=1 Tax=Jannaschia pagri TaxID=2829797 RepID=A0ABQ4NPH8_9RHOB|nr:MULTISPECIES: hypothetical protein [unclassified Jannaschia]GIT92406.1 hypothetical protein JANAI61_28640 [Jannaschia sp. AI_61]GIT96241.1 hypothetical protein JANAI62_28640 [Jannaschia sp. AI_62]